jgi:acyl-CoA synthetase (AMP-forming)/AMP-acid ligase II
MKRCNLVSCLRSVTDGNAGVILINDRGEEFLPYSLLYRRSTAASLALRGIGAGNGDEVVLQIEDNASYLTAFWACLLGGHIAVPLTAGIREERLRKVRQVWQRLKQPWLLTTRAQLSRLHSYWTACGEDGERLRARTLLIDALDFDPSLFSIADAEPRPNDTAFLQFSSGSTGDPKGVILTHANVLANCNAFIERAHVTEADFPLSWMPLTHDMGLIGSHLGAVVRGVSSAFMPTNLFVRRPLQWLEKAHQHKATILMSPNFGLQYTLSAYRESRRDAAWDLSKVRLIWNGAEPISYELCRDFLETFAPFGLQPGTIYPCYGLAEATVAATLGDPGEPLKYHRIRSAPLALGRQVEWANSEEEPASLLTECGYALPCCEVAIGNEEGKLLPPWHVGYVLIRGVSVTQGYYRDTVATAQAARAGGWMDTGDLGFLSITGRLTITGRVKDIIIIDGINIFPQDIERLVETVDGVTAGQVAVCGVRSKVHCSRPALAAFVVFRRAAAAFDPLASAIRRRIMERAGLRLHYVLPIGRLPRTTSGKIRRFQLTEAFNEGQFDELLDCKARLSREEPSLEVGARPVFLANPRHSGAVRFDGTPVWSQRGDQRDERLSEILP